MNQNLSSPSEQISPKYIDCYLHVYMKVCKVNNNNDNDNDYGNDIYNDNSNNNSIIIIIIINRTWVKLYK